MLQIVQQYARAMGLEKLAPHDMRRTCAKLCRKRGGDEQIKFLLGHASIQTTERYFGAEQDFVSAVNDNLGLERSLLLCNSLLSAVRWKIGKISGSEPLETEPYSRLPLQIRRLQLAGRGAGCKPSLGENRQYRCGQAGAHWDRSGLKSFD